MADTKTPKNAASFDINDPALQIELGDDADNVVDFPLPQKGKRPFTQSPDAAQLDVLGCTGVGEQRSLIGRRGLYADGYKESADLLVELVKGMQQHRTLYAIVYLYRHWLELTLKGLVTYSYHLKTDWQTGQREDRLNGLTRCHDLEKLWSELKRFLPQLSLGLALETTEAVDSQIKELSAHGENGQAFRYPLSTRSAQPLRMLNGIDLSNLKLRMQEMQNYLGIVHEAVYERLNPDEV